MGSSDIAEILRAIGALRGDVERLDEKVDKTNIEAAKTSAGVTALEGWAESLDGKFERERHQRELLGREVSGQTVEIRGIAHSLAIHAEECPARRADAIRRDVEATGKWKAAHSLPPNARVKIELARWKVVGLAISSIVAALLAYLQLR